MGDEGAGGRHGDVGTTAHVQVDVEIVALEQSGGRGHHVDRDAIAPPDDLGPERRLRPQVDDPVAVDPYEERGFHTRAEMAASR
jgi:hypothetical protein